MFNIYEALSTGVGKVVAAVVVVAVGIAAEGVLESWLNSSGDRPVMVEIASISIDEHHRIVVGEHAQSMTDVRIMMCSLVKDEQPVVEDVIFGMTNLEPETFNFQLLRTLDGDLIGVVEASNPQVLILTWQLSETSPGLYDVGLTDAAAAQLKSHVEIFGRQNPQVQYEHLSLIRQKEFGQSGGSRSRMIW